MELSEARIDTQVLVAVIAHNVGKRPVRSALTAVSAVASFVYMTWIVTYWGPASPCWTRTPSGCSLRRVCSRHMLHERDAKL